MGNIVQFPGRRHWRASAGSGVMGKQSSAVTSPSVSNLIAVANGADSHVLRFRMRLIVDRSQGTPRSRIRAAMASSSNPRSDMKSASCMSANVHQAHIYVKPPCAWVGMENCDPPVHDAHSMAKKPKPKAKPAWRASNLRPWREHADKTLEDVAPKMGLKHSQLSRVERGFQMYNQRILEVAALEYGCTIADILERLPPEAKVIHPAAADFAKRARRG